MSKGEGTLLLPVRFSKIPVVTKVKKKIKILVAFKATNNNNPLQLIFEIGHTQ